MISYCMEKLDISDSIRPDFFSLQKLCFRSKELQKSLEKSLVFELRNRIEFHAEESDNSAYFLPPLKLVPCSVERNRLAFQAVL